MKNFNYFSSKVYSTIIILSASLLLYNFIIITTYQYTYLNIFSGPSKNRFNKFENDYWGASIKELINKVQFDKSEAIKISACGINLKVSKRYFENSMFLIAS